jgi:hypothetical protein
MKAAIAPRQPSQFKLRYHACSDEVEIEVDLILDGWAPCPSCTCPLLIRWTALAQVPA